MPSRKGEPWAHAKETIGDERRSPVPKVLRKEGRFSAGDWTYEEDELLTSCREHVPVRTFEQVVTLIYEKLGKRRTLNGAIGRYNRLVAEAEADLGRAMSRKRDREARNRARLTPPLGDRYEPRPDGFVVPTPTEKARLAREKAVMEQAAIDANIKVRRPVQKPVYRPSWTA